jgi:type IV secretory pathway VirB6-like protein
MAGIENMFAKVDDLATDYVAGGYQSVANEIAPAFWTGFTLFTIIWGINYLRTGRGNFTDISMTMMRGGLIGYVGLNWGVFSDWAYGSLQAIQDQLGGVLMQIGDYGGAAAPGEGAISGGTVIEQAFGRILKGFNALLSQFDIMGNWEPLFAGLFILIGGVLLLGFGAFVLLFSKMAFAITVVLGPAFIPTAMFSATRDIFGAWVRSVAGFTVIPVLATGVIAFSLALLDENIAEAETGLIDLTTAAVTLFVMVAMWYLIRQVPSIAGGMVGAASVSGASAMADMFTKPLAREMTGIGMGARYLRDRAAQRWGSNVELGKIETARKIAQSAEKRREAA